MSAQIGGIPIPIVLIGCFLVAGSLLQSRTTEGRKLYAIGSSLAAARVVGLPIEALTIAAYGISGLCAGIAGLLLAGYSSSATLDMGDPFLMPTTAAVVIGGACVIRGRCGQHCDIGGANFVTEASANMIRLMPLLGFAN